MKRLLYLLTTLALFIACDANQGDSSIKTTTLEYVAETDVTRNGDDTYTLEATFYGDGYHVTFALKNTTTIFPEGTYQVTSDLNNGCKVRVSDGTSIRAISDGTVKVSKKDGQYEINADLKTKLSGYKFHYKGELAFHLDLTVSENTIIVTESDLTMTNSNWEVAVVAGVKKYTLTVISPENEALASVELVNAPGKTLTELVGDYTLRANSAASGSAIAGAVSWGNGSGSWYREPGGSELYISGGEIKLSAMEDGESGTGFYTLTGSNISTVNLAGTNGSGSLQHKNMIQAEYNASIIRNRTVSSKAMGREMKYSIYLPGNYEEGESYPVLYLLHGYGDENNAWIDKGMLIPAAYCHEKNGGKPMIVVCPDGLTTFYYDSRATKFETYFFDELVPEIEKTYKVKTDRNSRAVAGLSMGGFGTLYYGLKYPDLFCYAYACSAAIDMGAGYPSLYDLARNADPAQLPGITLEMGTEDYTTGNGAGFHSTLIEEGIDHEYIARAGTHDWKFWQVCLPKIFKRCGEAFE